MVRTGHIIKAASATLVLFLGVGSCAASSQTETLCLVKDGQAQSVIVVSEKASKDIKYAANVLQRYLRLSSGARVRVVEEKTPAFIFGTHIQIHVGSTNYADRLDLDMESLDGDGYVLRGIDNGHFVILGPTDRGTEFGVYEFLERYLGVRWLMPGNDGDDVPIHDTIEIPAEEVRDGPVFFSNDLAGLATPAMQIWHRYNRARRRVDFGHNLLNLFPPSKYGRTHPEFFPVYNGKRYIPVANDVRWQPCFSAEGLVEEAVKNICEYFQAHPEVTSYSLGINDTTKFCQCERCQVRYPEQKNFLGYVHASDLYFEWCNGVVEGVLKEYPDKRFGLLAYSNVIEPPDSVKIHPRIIPYITYDRMKWCVSNIRQSDQDMTKRWQKMSPILGWYDYIYGSPYMLPRVYFHLMEDYLKFARDHGVKVLVAEAYPNWGEGPKLYIALKLQWNPDQDVDALLSEWYVRAVGEDAAPHLAEYYQHWEYFWTRRVVNSPWFTEQGQYLHFNIPGYLAEVSEKDIFDSRRLLETVVAKAKTRKQKARAELLLRAFEYYEASAFAYSGELRATITEVSSVDDALNVLAEGSRCLEFADKRVRLIYEDFANDPVLKHRLVPDRYQKISGRDWGGALFRLAQEWADNEIVNKRLRELASESQSESVRKQARAMLARAKK